MNWLEINDKIAEINELQQELLSKLNGNSIKEIFARKEKYLTDILPELSKLNNAALENKIKVTPFELEIIGKINELELPLTMDQIYKKLSENENNSASYIEMLLRNYNDVLSAVNTLDFIEEIAGTEQHEEIDYEETEYAKLLEFINSFLIDYVKNANVNNVEDFEDILSSKMHDYFEKLTDSQITTILSEYISLSYNRNRYNYFEEIKVISKIKLSNNLSTADVMLFEGTYPMYIEIVKRKLYGFYFNRSLEDINRDFKEIKNNYKNKNK